MNRAGIHQKNCIRHLRSHREKETRMNNHLRKEFSKTFIYKFKNKKKKKKKKKKSKNVFHNLLIINYQIINYFIY